MAGRTEVEDRQPAMTEPDIPLRLGRGHGLTPAKELASLVVWPAMRHFVAHLIDDRRRAVDALRLDDRSYATHQPTCRLNARKVLPHCTFEPEHVQLRRVDADSRTLQFDRPLRCGATA